MEGSLVLRKIIRRASSVITPRNRRRRMSFGLMVDMGMVECGITILGRERLEVFDNSVVG